jgi:16S rRNA (guanine527-N7)-methyltransferase
MLTASFSEQTAALGLDLTSAQLASFGLYRDLILEAAERFNLTAVRDSVEIERRHFLESLALGVELVRRGALPADHVARVIDVGTGAGLPGVALKLAWPKVEIALLDSNQKRCRFLRYLIERLALAGVRVLEGRAETIARDTAERETYDLAVARALAPLPILLEYCLPFVAPGGWLAAPKGIAAPRELGEAARALDELGGVVQEAAPFLPPGGPPGTLILVRKMRQTPERYPRRPGVAAKRPL